MADFLTDMIRSPIEHTYKSFITASVVMCKTKKQRTQLVVFARRLLFSLGRPKTVSLTDPLISLSS